MAIITIKFFKIYKLRPDSPNFNDALARIFAFGSKASEREKDVFGQTLRLERLVKNDDFFDGEIVRKQTGDMQGKRLTYRELIADAK